MVRSVVLAAVVSAWATAAVAAGQPLYQPPPAWVKPVAIPASAAPGGAAVQLLLQNQQMRFGDDSDDTFQEFAAKVVSAAGLSPVGNFILPWSPDTDTLIIHRLNIVRGGQTIDALDGGKRVTVIRRETNLESATLDGTLTATIQPEGLQVGDVVDLAYTLRRHDPVLAGHSEALVALARPACSAGLTSARSGPRRNRCIGASRAGLATPGSRKPPRARKR